MRAHDAILMILLAGAACSRSAPPGPPDAQAGVAPRIVRPRVIVPGETPVDVAESKVTLTIIKDRDTVSPVVATMRARDGGVSLGASPASARLSIDLDSFDSGIPIRNERVRNLFFETSGVGWDSAELVIPAIPPAVVAALATERRASATLDGTITVHGRAAPITLAVDASYAPDGRLRVTSARPIEVRISAFALESNLRRLSAICMHDSIDDVVHADASFVFGKGTAAP